MDKNLVEFTEAWLKTNCTKSEQKLQNFAQEIQFKGFLVVLWAYLKKINFGALSVVSLNFSTQSGFCYIEIKKRP